MGPGYRAEGPGYQSTQRGCHDVTDGLGIPLEWWGHWVCESRFLGLYTFQVIMLTLLRNIAQYSMVSTKAPRDTLAKNTTASIDGRPTKAASWHLRSPHTTISSCTSQEAMTTRSRSGILLAVTQDLMASKKCMRTNLSNPCRNSFRSKLSLPDQIMPKIAGVEQHFYGPSSRNMARRPRC